MTFWQRVLAIVFCTLIVLSCGIVGIAAAFAFSAPWMVFPFIVLAVAICLLGWESPAGLAGTLLWMVLAALVLHMMPE